MKVTELPLSICLVGLFAVYCASILCVYSDLHTLFVLCLAVMPDRLKTVGLVTFGQQNSNGLKP